MGGDATDASGGRDGKVKVWKDPSTGVILTRGAIGEQPDGRPNMEGDHEIPLFRLSIAFRTGTRIPWHDTELQPAAEPEAGPRAKGSGKGAAASGAQASIDPVGEGARVHESLSWKGQLRR